MDHYMKIKSLVLAGICGASMMNQAGATFIDGSIDFASLPGALVSLQGPGTPDFHTATGLTFDAGPNAKVAGATGDFAAELIVPPSSPNTATFSSFLFSGGVKPLWVLTDGNFSFDLNPGAVVVRGDHFLEL